MRRRVIFYIIFFFRGCFPAATAQELDGPAMKAYSGLGAYSSAHTDVFSFPVNQAALSGMKTAAAGISSERKFLTSELTSYMAVVALPVPPGCFGIRAAYSGFRDYNEGQLGLAYGRALGAKTAVGIQLNYHSLKIVQYGKTAAFGFEIATLFHVTERLQTGLHLSNPVGGRWKNAQQEKLPSAYAIGFGYDASEIVFLSVEIGKEEGRPVNANTGFEYRPLRQCCLRGGISTATATGWFGAGFHWRIFRFDILSSYHPQLGITPGILLAVAFQKEN